MDVQATKLELITLLLNTQKEDILIRLKQVFEQDELESFDLTTQNEMIETAKKSENDIKAGRVFSIDEAETQLKQKLGF